LADSGTTTDPTIDPSQRVQAYISAASAVNKVMGVALPVPAFTISGVGTSDPQVTVNVQAVVPTFFAKIFRRNMVTIAATATAEAYSPQISTGVPQVAATCLKPWLVGNSIRVTLGEKLTLTPATCCALGARQYLPAQVVFGSNTPVVPSQALGDDDYVQAIVGCSELDWITASGTPPQVDSMNLTTDIAETASAVESLLGAVSTGPGQGQDTLEPDGSGQPWPVWIEAGTYWWPPSLQGKLVTTSHSLVVIPVVNSSQLLPVNTPIPIVGLLKAFIEQVPDNSGSIAITVFGVSVNPQSVTGQSPVSGGGVDAIAVRLIHQ
jgi:hypothetical protein